jgi:hypothetical protein
MKPSFDHIYLEVGSILRNAKGIGMYMFIYTQKRINDVYFRCSSVYSPASDYAGA